MHMENNSIFLQQLIDSIPNPIFYKDVNGLYKFCNNAFEEYLGIKKNNIIDHTAHQLCPKELADIYQKADLELIEKKGSQYYETQVKHSDGSYHYVYFVKATLLDKNGDVEGIVGIINDITEQKRVDNKIKRLLKLKESMLEVNHAIMNIIDIDELFNLILEKALNAIENAKSGAILRLGEKSLLYIAAYKGPEHKKIDEFSMKLEDYYIWNSDKLDSCKTIIIDDIHRSAIINSEFVRENDYLKNIKSLISSPIIIEGNLYGFIVVVSPKKNIFDHNDAELLEYLTNQANMTISKHILYEQTIYLTRYDNLTNVFNRRYFEELVNQLILKQIRYNEDFLLVIFDLNGLKAVNDTYGHLAGDELIKTFISKLNSNVRSTDTLARLGGDEFVGVFFNTDKEKLIRKFEDLIKYFKDNPIIFEEENIICSFSYGFAHYPVDGENYSQLLTVVDKDMYEYKRNFYKNKI